MALYFLSSHLLLSLISTFFSLLLLFLSLSFSDGYISPFSLSFLLFLAPLLMSLLSSFFPFFSRLVLFSHIYHYLIIFLLLILLSLLSSFFLVHSWKTSVCFPSPSLYLSISATALLGLTNWLAPTAAVVPLAFLSTLEQLLPLWLYTCSIGSCLWSFLARWFARRDLVSTRSPWTAGSWSSSSSLPSRSRCSLG